jgi:integral membrane protein (TIGR01906 family)
MPSVLRSALSWLTTIAIPVVLVLTAVRLLTTPLFLRFEYNTPGFPPDPYGFTKQDRLYWSNIAREYLLNDAGISFLADLKFDNGQPVYNQRELRHMVDVKRVFQAALKVWYGGLVLLLGMGLWAWRGNWMPDYLHGVSRGGWLTIIVLGSIVLFVLLSFGVLFVAFHNIFFQAGTWQFFYSDTLIRLFPERFWRDAFMLIGLLAMGGGLALGYFIKPHMVTAAPPASEGGEG